MKLNQNNLYKNKYEFREEIYRSTDVLIPKKGKILFVGLDCITDVQHYDGTRKFNVLGISKDSSKVESVKKLGIKAEVKDVLDLDEDEKFDLIWLAEEVNTLSDEEVLAILKKANTLLNKRGFIFCDFAYRYNDGKTSMNEKGIYYRDEFSVHSLLNNANLKEEEKNMRLVTEEDKVTERWYHVLASKN